MTVLQVNLELAAQLAQQICVGTMHNVKRPGELLLARAVMQLREERDHFETVYALSSGERDAALAEIERMRPVVQAAEQVVAAAKLVEAGRGDEVPEWDAGVATSLEAALDAYHASKAAP